LILNTDADGIGLQEDHFYADPMYAFVVGRPGG
jgi:hypothetical protein